MVCAGTGYTLCPDLATSGRTLTTWLETINQGGKRLILNGWKHYVCHCNSPGRENLEKNERCDREKKERKKKRERVREHTLDNRHVLVHWCTLHKGSGSLVLFSLLILLFTDKAIF